MRKTLTVLGLTLAIAGAAQAQDYFNPPTLEKRNASGFPYYMLEMPDAALKNLKIDGYDDDWAWFDPEYVLTNDEFKDEADLPRPSRDDYDVTAKMAWKGAPENRWYVFMAIHDDTLQHNGTEVRRWAGDMLGFILDPQDHGRTRGALGFSQEYVAAPGNVQANFAERYPESEGGPGPAAWREFGEPPYLVGKVRVDPPEAWAADSWTSDTGGDTYYEYSVVAWDLFEEGGPSVSNRRDLNAQAGADGAGLAFVFFAEDGEGGRYEQDWTTRGAEATARQYFSLAKLLRANEFTAATAVEETTWGRIKSSF